MKQQVKELFAAIRRGSNDVVRGLLASHPELVNARAQSPPKSDDGQSPLQVAIKHSNYEIAELLLDLGANVRFQETSAINEWTAPILHDAIRSAIHCRAYFAAGSTEVAAAFRILQRMLSAGADANVPDSYGNTPLMRALLDARQRVASKPGFPQTIGDAAEQAGLQRVFAALLAAGADPHLATSTRPSPIEAYAHEPALVALLR